MASKPPTTIQKPAPFVDMSDKAQAALEYERRAKGSFFGPMLTKNRRKMGIPDPVGGAVEKFS